MGVIVAIVLYADDAEPPADSPEDLQLAADILQDFCNDHRLFMATSKTFVTVFHPATTVAWFTKVANSWWMGRL